MNVSKNNVRTKNIYCSDISIENKTKIELIEAFFQEKECSTPSLFMFESEIKKSLSFFREHLPQVNLFYAVKTNPHHLVVDYFQQQNLGFDVASAEEVNLLLNKGSTGEKMILSHPIKNSRTLERIFSQKLLAYTFDNVSELEKIAAFRHQKGFQHNPLALVRIRIESEGVQINLNEKFGCAIEEAPVLLKKAADLGLNPGGVAFHVGTQSYLADNYAKGIKAGQLIGDIVKNKYGIKLSVIDIGGGYPDRFLAEKEGVNLDDFFSQIGKYCQEAIDLGFDIYAEPGRFLVSSSGVLATSVIGSNIRHGSPWLYLDDGIYGCFSGRIFDHKEFSFIPASNGKTKHSEELIPFVIAGPTCDSIDLVNDSCLLPDNVKVGDILCSLNLGAYSWATAGSFNGFAPAEVVFMPEQKVVKNKQREAKKVAVKQVDLAA